MPGYKSKYRYCVKLTNKNSFVLHIHNGMYGEMKTGLRCTILLYILCILVCCRSYCKVEMLLLPHQTDAHIHISGNQGRPALLFTMKSVVLLLNPDNPLLHNLLCYSINCIHLYFISFYCSCNRGRLCKVEGCTSRPRGALLIYTDGGGVLWNTSSHGFSGNFKSHSVRLK